MLKHPAEKVFYIVSAVQTVLTSALIAMIVAFVPKENFTAAILMIAICLVLFVTVGALNIALYSIRKQNKK